MAGILGRAIERLGAGLRGMRRRDVPVIPTCPSPEFAGKWVAWSGDGQQIVASGDTLAEVQERVRRAQAGGVSYERLPPLLRGVNPGAG
jgi:hypothetical protein